MLLSNIFVLIVGASFFTAVVGGPAASSNEGVAAIADRCKCSPTTQDARENITRCECHSRSTTYLKSMNDANLNGAVGDCKTRYNGMLTCIEKKGELDSIQEVLDGIGNTGHNYWVNAAFDTKSGEWEWLCSKPLKSPFFHGFPWASGHPNVPAGSESVYGIELIYDGPGTDIKFKTRAHSDSSRYLCES